MSRIVVDAELSRKLHGLCGSVEVYDPSGKVLGRFTPAIVDLSEWEQVSPDISEEELDRLEKSEEWHTTDQLMEHLHKLENS